MSDLGRKDQWKEGGHARCPSPDLPAGLLPYPPRIQTTINASPTSYQVTNRIKPYGNIVQRSTWPVPFGPAITVHLDMIPCLYIRPNRYQVWSVFFCFFFSSSLLLSSSTRRRFYPQRSSGQAVVIGVVLSPPRYVPSIFIAHRVQHSHCSPIFIECC